LVLQEGPLILGDNRPRTNPSSGHARMFPFFGIAIGYGHVHAHLPRLSLRTRAGFATRQEGSRCPGAEDLGRAKGVAKREESRTTSTPSIDEGGVKATTQHLTACKSIGLVSALCWVAQWSPWQKRSFFFSSPLGALCETLCL